MDRRSFAAAVLFLLPFLVLSRLGPLEGALPIYWACLGAAFLVYGFAWAENRAPIGIGPILAIGMAARLILLPLPPSDDIYRFIWEGKVSLNGFSPYLLAPDHPYLAFLRDADWARINHPHLPTLYPPLAQALFRLLARLGPKILVFKAGFLACDVATFFALSGLLRGRRDKGESLGGNESLRGTGPAYQYASHVLAAYFLNPLLIFESAGRGHFDALSAGLNVAFLWALGSGWAPAWLGMGGLAKISSLALAPLLVLRDGWRRGAAWALAACAAVGMLLWRVGALDVLRRFATRFRFNGAVPGLMDYGFPFLPAMARNALLAALFCAVLGACLWRTRRDPPESQALACLGTVLLFSPTLHPWYLIWILPFATLRLNRPWLLLTATSLISYEVYARMAATGAWSERVWLRLPEYLPPLMLGAWLAWCRGREKTE
ncbi:MAG: hypothetical protein JF616_17560 [Fibrobacteres bacterium]|nr:hypothetical protein [Fibrobacterota bacterium]